MATVVINENSDQGRMFANMMREANKVYPAIISIEEDDLDHIPGLPRTREECIASLRRSVEEYRMTGVTVSMEEMMAKHPRI